jgi:phosphoribosyl 1,2-cyclic phosphodiesterase
MTARFTVLASGSSGNACLLQAAGRGLLIDCGVGPRVLARRLAVHGLGWRHVHAVVLTHTHGDHWHEATLVYLHRLRLPFYCHPSHDESLARCSPAFAALRSVACVRHYDGASPFEPLASLSCRPLPVSHDGGETFAFRFEGSPGLFGPTWTLGYAADLGCWDDGLALALADVDLLAVEFNHDEDLQRRSGRPDTLIRRVLGDRGHLSNSQGAGLVQAALAASHHRCLRHVVPLHLSRECNRPELARGSAATALRAAGSAASVHLPAADGGGPSLVLGAPAPAGRGRRERRPTASPVVPLWGTDRADAG